MNALLDPKTPLKAQLEKKSDFFRAAIKDAAAQGAFLAAFELFVSDDAAEQAKTLPVVLQVMYDKDIVEEDVLVRAAPFPYTRKAAGPAGLLPTAAPPGVCKLASLRESTPSLLLCAVRVVRQPGRGQEVRRVRGRREADPREVGQVHRVAQASDQ